MASANLARILIAPRSETRINIPETYNILYIFFSSYVTNDCVILCYSGLPETVKEGTESEETATGAVGPGDQEAHAIGGGPQSHGRILGASQSDYRYVRIIFLMNKPLH